MCLSLRLHFTLAPSGIPANFTARTLDSRSIHLSWDPLPSALQNGIIRQYRVTILHNAGEARVINTTATSVTIAALIPFTMYNFTVAAETIAVGPSTPPLQIVTPQDGNHSKYIFNTRNQDTSSKIHK